MFIEELVFIIIILINLFSFNLNKTFLNMTRLIVHTFVVGCELALLTMIEFVIILV